MSKKTLVLSSGQKGQNGQNPPHSGDLEKKSNFSKIFFAFFCELNHSEQENQKKCLETFSPF